MTGPQGIAAIPPGFTIRVDPETRYDAAAASVWGGSPRRLMRLTPAGAEALHRLAGGVPVADRRTGLLARRLVEAGLAHPRPPLHVETLAVEVVVPVRDRARDLDECLQALGGTLPVTVVDDASADAAAIAAVAARHGASVLRLPRNGGPAAARNAGLGATGSAAVAFVDSDCRIGAADIFDLVGQLADPCVAVAAPRVRPGTEGRSVVGRYAASRSPLDLGPRAATVRPDGRVTYVPAAALVVRRAALVDVGGFDETLRYGEDVDLVWRLVDAGWSVRYVPGTTARHREPLDWPSWWQRRYRYGTSAGALAARHRSRLAGPPLSGLVAPLTLARRTRGRPLPSGTRRRVALGAPATTALGLARWANPLWGPAALAVARRSRTRRLLVAVAVVPVAVEWWQRRPALDPMRWTAAALADDLAYGAGVWAGCVRARTVAPLLPRVSGSRRPSSP